MNSLVRGLCPHAGAGTAVLLVAMAGSVSAAQEYVHEHDGFEQHGAHEHGVLTFNVALEGGQLFIEFEAPADNVLGFEHAPRTEAEKAAVHEAAAWLKSGRELFAFPPAAACRWQATELDEPEWQSGGRHADYEARFSYQCGEPQRLDWLQLALLGKLREVHEARVNVLTPSRQASDNVKSAGARVRLK